MIVQSAAHRPYSVAHCVGCSPLPTLHTHTLHPKAKEHPSSPVAPTQHADAALGLTLNVNPNPEPPSPVRYIYTYSVQTVNYQYNQYQYIRMPHGMHVCINVCLDVP